MMIEKCISNSNGICLYTWVVWTLSHDICLLFIATDLNQLVKLTLNCIKLSCSKLIEFDIMKSLLGDKNVVLNVSLTDRQKVRLNSRSLKLTFQMNDSDAIWSVQ